MPAEVNPTPARIVPQQPLVGGRYQVEFRRHPCPRCTLSTVQAVLLLLYLQAEVETEREVSDVVCSACQPERFARLQALAPHLG